LKEDLKKENRRVGVKDYYGEVVTAEPYDEGRVDTGVSCSLLGGAALGGGSTFAGLGATDALLGAAVELASLAGSGSTALGTESLAGLGATVAFLGAAGELAALAGSGSTALGAPCLAGLGGTDTLLGTACKLALVAGSLGDLGDGLGGGFLSDSSCHCD
jgi:hypothetical protein